MQVAEKACECLSGIIGPLSKQGSNSLVKLVLADQQVCGDLLGCVSGMKQHGSRDPSLHVHTLTKVAAAVSLLQSKVYSTYLLTGHLVAVSTHRSSASCSGVSRLVLELHLQPQHCSHRM